MRKFDNPIINFAAWGYRCVTPIIIVKPMNAVRYFTFFFSDMVRYSFMDQSKTGMRRPKIIDWYPILNEKTSDTSIDAHYFYQAAWAARKIFASKTKEHVDVGSQVNLIGDLCAFTKVTFIDIRPLQVKIPNLTSKKGSILAMPYKSNSVSSLSCLHVAEHIGLGRYGDPLDPQGTKKAAKELARVLAKGGDLYFSGPVGKPRVCFNSHRIHSADQILEYFSDLKLVSMSLVEDKNWTFIENATIAQINSCSYGCGMFHFTKK